MSGTDTPADECPDADEEVDAAHLDDEIETSHLDDIDEGGGCAEVWEHLSEARQADGDGPSDAEREDP